MSAWTLKVSETASVSLASMCFLTVCDFLFLFLEESQIGDDG